MDPESIKQQIRDAFARAQCSGSWSVCDHYEDEESKMLRKEFANKPDWRKLEPEFLDEAPGGRGSALGLFSDEAFRYYLPAFLIADLDERLQRVDPVIQLCNGLNDESTFDESTSPRLSVRAWFEPSLHRFAVFSSDQCAAITAYLDYRKSRSSFDRSMIQSALKSYWSDRAGTHRR